ncbi:uncharacterized protein [Mycetomoellerius zeteki]|uniref:uncharacterized protein n=1 Tax=Mycetomoellerius zeteki TaxID=64791 RepID=UPI00084EA56E|nr:PREDICTED: uncharacterized protein LOC108727471 [Trachymyrmex zeteki]
MSDQLISVPVFVEDTGETIILKLLLQDAAKITKDINYMTSLIKNVYKKRNKNLINQESVQIPIDKSNEVQEFDDDPNDQSEYNYTRT